jgi:hypothetical protein
LTVNPGTASNKTTSGSMQAASQVAYFPEWFIPGGLGDESEHQWSDQAKSTGSETSGLFGLAGWNRFERAANTPCYQAHQDAGGGRPDYPELCAFYHQLHLLATGIQAAGAHLTPKSFAQGLQATRFPNPGAAGAPSFQARVGFNGDHVQIDDFALVWWNTAGTSHQVYDGQRNPGAFCYVENASRWRLGQLPSADAFFIRSSAQC